GYVYAVSGYPPPPQYEEVIVRPGYLWIGGHWAWNGGWVWAPGYYEVERPGYLWVGGVWTTHGGGSHWVPGYWRPRPNPGTVVVPSQPARQGDWRPGYYSKPAPSRPHPVHDYPR